MKIKTQQKTNPILNKQITLILLTLILSGLFSGCNSDEDSAVSPINEIDLSEAKLADFPFMELDYISIQILQPKIENNKALTEGEIIITLPHTATSLLLTLKLIDIEINKFNIFPSVGTKLYGKI